MSYYAVTSPALLVERLIYHRIVVWLTGEKLNGLSLLIMLDWTIMIMITRAKSRLERIVEILVKCQEVSQHPSAGKLK